MSKNSRAYPLCWPEGWRRFRPVERANNYSWKKTVDRYRDHMLDQVRMLGGENIVISTNVPLRRDGQFFADFKTPDDPGVAVYFSYNGKPICFACDKYTSVGDNIHAIGLTIEAMRQIERCGASDMLERAFTGFAALPQTSSASWREAFGLATNAIVTLDEVERIFRDLAKQTHPDAGGNDTLMRGLLEARTAARQELGKS
jgi:hypothetical protein